MVGRGVLFALFAGSSGLAVWLRGYVTCGLTASRFTLNPRCLVLLLQKL